MTTKIIPAIIVLALATLACGFNIDLPQRMAAGPEVEESITVVDPKSDDTHVTLSFGAGRLALSPGAENLVDGTVIYNVPDLKPEVRTNDGDIEIQQGDFHGLPPFEDLKNEWNLKLGAVPMDLTVQAGAYDADLELGGLALKSLTVRDGAASVQVSFDEPNRTEMSMLRYETGASDVTLSGLANANFSTLAFSGGAGNYTLDFSGELERDGVVTIEAGFGNLSLIIPDNVDARVTIESAAVNISRGRGWAQRGQEYVQQREGPTLKILVKMAAGNLLIGN